ncbi:AcrR family transcriptional regulator [Nocardia transvalensis]|uniref:AcrR family transcriptional regulator n=1 Tax=Nocardia transvalensis TaxID=37333 RepID=A0A7W9P9E0_9NOCA|nr:TetR/AcrR family transcriptional regulator [Nocardia transvalensis]MBB5911603.1 AcrR family transcriptional regulator [Nocardia transvalensis]
MTTAASTPAVRADARRNRALVLAAAQEAFAEYGTAVSLAEIARRAGVGAGTVHRHFPSKLDLLEAVVQQRIDRLTAVALDRRDGSAAGAAFLDFCTRVVVGTRGNKALCDVLETDDGWPRMLLREAGERFRRALGALLVAAQREGSVRADLTLPDVLAVFAGCVAIQRASPARRGVSRPVAMVLEAMLTESGRAVTKSGTSTGGRNENGADNVTRGHVGDCAICGAPLRHTGAGRPARYCSPACRQKAHRRRRGAPDIAAVPR